MFDLKRFVALVPTSEPHVRRLNNLLRTADEPPRIAVFGNHNHGKSRLLNALVGNDHFKVADKRETIAVSEHKCNGVVWVDTPGLDADPTRNDDRVAWKAAFQMADFLFLVHAVTEGELDLYEIRMFMELAKQDRNYRQKMALVLTKIDQREPTDAANVEKHCRAQLRARMDLRELDVMAASAVRYGNPKLRKMSGMDNIFARVEQVKAGSAVLKSREWARVTNKLMVELSDRHNDLQSEWAAAGHSVSDIQRRLQSAATELVGTLREG